jgi:hypothetical protein
MPPLAVLLHVAAACRCMPLRLAAAAPATWPSAASSVEPRCCLLAEQLAEPHRAVLLLELCRCPKPLSAPYPPRQGRRLHQRPISSAPSVFAGARVTPTPSSTPRHPHGSPAERRPVASTTGHPEPPAPQCRRRLPADDRVPIAAAERAAVPAAAPLRAAPPVEPSTPSPSTPGVSSSP